MGAIMNLKSAFLCSARFGAATAAATAVAMCLPASSAQVVVGEGASAGSAAMVVTTTGGFSGARWGDPTADRASKDAYGNYQAAQDPGSLYTVEKAIGARGLWTKEDSTGQALTGAGVSVAVLDSGVAPVPGLDGAGKVTYGPDLSIEANGVLTQQDTFGHGTFMAGIIAGRGTTTPSSDLSKAPARVQLGVAPDAGLLAMKLATTDGSVDVSQVIAALDWVTQHPVLPDGSRVRVINLSYGTDSAQAYLADPLAAATSAAATVIAYVAWPRSNCSRADCRSSCGTGATILIAAAAPATCPAPCHTFANSTSCVLSVTRTKSHGCQLLADGARRPASRIWFSASSGTGWAVNFRTLRRARSASHVSMTSFCTSTASPRRHPHIKQIW